MLHVAREMISGLPPGKSVMMLISVSSVLGCLCYSCYSDVLFPENTLVLQPSQPGLGWFVTSHTYTSLRLVGDFNWLSVGGQKPNTEGNNLVKSHSFNEDNLDQQNTESEPKKCSLVITLNLLFCGSLVFFPFLPLKFLFYLTFLPDIISWVPGSVAPYCGCNDYAYIGHCFIFDTPLKTGSAYGRTSQNFDLAQSSFLILVQFGSLQWPWGIRT